TRRMGTRAKFEHDGRQSQMAHSLGDGGAFVGKLLQGRTHEDAKSLVWSANHRAGRGVHTCRMPPRASSTRRALGGSRTWPPGGPRWTGLTVHTSATLIEHRLLAEFSVPSVAGNDRVAADRVAAAVHELPLTP